jgi:hypothetical protein
MILVLEEAMAVKTRDPCLILYGVPIMRNYD